MTRAAIEPGLIALPAEPGAAPRLLASLCRACAERFHPRRPVCLKCSSRDLEDVELDSSGTLYACTHVAGKLRPGQRDPARGYWVAQVDLEGGPRVQGLLAVEIDSPRIGMRLVLGLETLVRDAEGNETVVHCFRAVGDAG
jgi:uncharacterized OB-fold protein